VGFFLPKTQRKHAQLLYERRHCANVIDKTFLIIIIIPEHKKAPKGAFYRNKYRTLSWKV